MVAVVGKTDLSEKEDSGEMLVLALVGCVMAVYGVSSVDLRRLPKKCKQQITLQPIIRYSRTNLFKYSFLNRIVGEWNRLPCDIRRVTSVQDFKPEVSRFLAQF